MKYFAKYLPVEGEIKEGDMFSYHEAEHPFVCKDITDIDDDCYKVKLFLCSKNIQVDDEVINLEIDSTPVTVDNIVKDSVWFQETPGEYRLKDCFKVIGEISPEATWVKEGDEFEEDEIEKKVNLGTALSPFYRFWIEGRDKIGYKCVVFIKGPCGHFH